MRNKKVLGLAFSVSLVFATPLAAYAENLGKNNPVDQCVANLKYNKTEIVNQRGGSIENLPPTSTSLEDGTYTVVTREKKTINNPQSNFSSAGLNSSDIYPGALVKVNESLMDNHPVLLAAKRGQKPLTISADLPGSYESYAEVKNANPATVNHQIGGILESWNEKAAPKYGTQSARVVFNESMVHSKKQAEAAFGGSFNVALAKIGVDFNAASKGEKQIYVASLQQIFYTVSANPPVKPSDWVAAESANLVCGGKTVPGYISSVDYGRQIYVVAETSSKDTDVKAAFSLAIKNQNAKLSAHYASLINQSNIKAVVLGGNAATQIKVTSGNIDEIRNVIKQGATYSRLNPAVPISYTVKYLKDNSVATSRSVAEYYDTTVKTYKQGKLVIKNRGGYVAQYRVSWDEVTGFDAKGKPIMVHKEWENNWKGRTSGAEDLIVLPANARNINVMVRECTGLAWNWWRTIVDEHNLALVPERTISVWGTTLNPHSSNVVENK